MYDGRMIQLIVMELKQDQPHRLFADISVSAQMLADKCKNKEGNLANITVSFIFSFKYIYIYF